MYSQCRGEDKALPASVSYLRQMMKSGLESIIIPRVTEEEIHTCSFDQSPFRKGEFGKLEASQADLGLNLKSLNFPRESKGGKMIKCYCT